MSLKQSLDYLLCNSKMNNTKLFHSFYNPLLSVHRIVQVPTLQAGGNSEEKMYIPLSIVLSVEAAESMTNGEGFTLNGSFLTSITLSMLMKPATSSRY